MDHTLKVLAVGDPAVDAYIHHRLVETFNQKYHKNVEFTIVPWNDYYNTMMDTFYGKYHFDIVMVAGHLWLKDFVEKEFLAEVVYPQTSEYDYEDILSVISDEMKVNNKAYLYPSFCDGHFLLYRKSVVERIYGEVPPMIDTNTIATLASLCEGVDDMNGIALKADVSEIFLDFLPYLRNEGIDAFDKDTHAPTFNNDKGKKALQTYLKLKVFAPDHVDSYGNDQVRLAFQQRKVALATTWGGQLGVVLDRHCQDIDDVGFAAIKTAWNVTWSFAICEKSQNKQLANEFLAYLTTPQVDRLVGSFAGSPVRKSTYVTDMDKFSWYNTHLMLIEQYAKPLPMMNQAGEIMAPLYEYIHAAFTGKLTIEEALQKAEEKVLQIQHGRLKS